MIARNLERVLTARLRDARFFWDADRKAASGGFVERLDTVLFHKKLGSYREKAERVEPLARVDLQRRPGPPELADAAAEAGRLCKADLATDMVRELTELQGTMGGIYAREDGRPEEVWKAIYYHYLPVGVEADAPPTRAQLGAAAVTWAAVSLADKLDTLVGMFAAGERPTGSRDPVRPAAGGPGPGSHPHRPARADRRRSRPAPRDAARSGRPARSGRRAPTGGRPLDAFLLDRVRYVLEQRGTDVRNVRAVTHGALGDAGAALMPGGCWRCCRSSPRPRSSARWPWSSSACATSPHDARRGVRPAVRPTSAPSSQGLTEPAETALAQELLARRGTIMFAADSGSGYREALAEAAKYGPSVATFFDDVLVMADDPKVRQARLFLMKALERQILRLADVSEIVLQES